MATAAGDSTPYGGGAGGKFRKTPSRRPQMTPYDRPPTALRSAQIYNDNSSNGGWLSRIVDPASKLISTSAHKFYSSVFRKRLLPPPQAPPDENAQPPENHLRHVIIEDPSRVQVGEMNVEKTQIHGSVTNGVAELEHMLKQKTFTRSERDRLTALLHSRIVDKTGVLGKSGFELTKPFELPAVNSSREEFDGPAHENGFSPSEGTDLTLAFRSKVNDDDVASPADLAKAYMGSRCTKMSLSRLGPRNHAHREEPPALSPFQLHRPTMSTVQKPLSNPGTSQSDVISRSRGRSAIYHMARTPYSRVMHTATKTLGTSNGAFDGQSLSSHKPLKRRCSILENDIGSVGPIRRIRQKSNLLYPKTLGHPSHTLLTHTTHSEVGEASLYSSPKSHSLEDRGDKSLPVSSSHVPSKSIEMGQRILQQLEKLSPPREKSSEKESRASGGISAMELTPGVLHGQADKSLETGGSLTCLQRDQVNCKKADPHAVSVCEVRDSTPRKQGNDHYTSSKELMNPSYKAYPENKEAKIPNGDIRVGSNCTDPVVLKSTDDVPKRSQAFQNGEHEDYLKLEASRMHSNSNVLLDNPSFPEAAKADNLAFPEIQPSSNSLLKKNIVADSSTSAEKSITQSIAMDNALKKKNGFSALPCSQTHLSDKADDVKSQRPSSVLAFAAGATDAALKSPGFNSKSTESVNIFKQSDNTPSSFPGSTNSTISFKMPAITSNGNISSLGSSHVTPSPVLFSSQGSSSGSSAQSTFTASTTTTINAGVSAKNVGDDANGSMNATINGNSSNSTSSVAFPSFQPSLKFGVPMASYSGVKETAGTDTVSYSKEKAFGSSTSSSVSVVASAATSSFQFGPSTVSSTNGELQASDIVSSHVISDQQVLSSAIVASTTQSMPSQPAASALPVSSGSSSLAINSGVNQLGSLTSVSAPFSLSAISGSTGSALTSIFGGNTSWQPSNSPVFGSTVNSSSGFSFGASSASSSASSGFALGTSVSVPSNGSLAGVTAAGSTTSVFAFGSSSSSVPSSIASPAFSFGGSSSSVPSSTTSSAFTFGSSAASATATPSSVFMFGSVASSPAPTTLQPSHSIFGNGSPVFAFGPTPSPSAVGNNDQMSMDATMVEDTRSSAPTAQPTAFGQSPANNFAFGMAPAPSPSGPNPFQLGTQQNQFTATQNPFQASGSFDGGGGFSLGAGGNDKSNRRIVKVSRRVRKK